MGESEREGMTYSDTVMFKYLTYNQINILQTLSKIGLRCFDFESDFEVNFFKNKY